MEYGLHLPLPPLAFSAFAPFSFMCKHGSHGIIELFDGFDLMIII